MPKEYGKYGELDMGHLAYLQQVANNDVQEIVNKEETYKGSWKRRGGIGAAMMMLRKIDRLEQMLIDYRYDIFERIEHEGLVSIDGTTIAEVRDLRRYLLLIEAEMISRENSTSNFTQEKGLRVPPSIPIGMFEQNYPGTPEDGGHHAKVLERLDDGLKKIPPEHQEYYMSMPTNGKAYHIVDRNKVPEELWMHLPRLRVELNNKEHEELLPEYYGIYRWDESGSKWVMRDHYKDNWGK